MYLMQLESTSKTMNMFRWVVYFNFKTLSKLLYTYIIIKSYNGFNSFFEGTFIVHFFHLYLLFLLLSFFLTFLIEEIFFKTQVHNGSLMKLLLLKKDLTHDHNCSCRCIKFHNSQLIIKY